MRGPSKIYANNLIRKNMCSCLEEASFYCFCWHKNCRLKHRENIGKSLVISSKKSKNIMFLLIFILLLIFVLEATSYVAGKIVTSWAPNVDLKRTSMIFSEQKQKILRYLEDQNNNAVFDSELGWVYRPSFRGKLYSNNSVCLWGP